MSATGYEWVKMADGRERLVPVTEEAQREHYGTRYEARDTKTAGYRLTPEEKKRLFVQTGQNFEDHGQYKEWCKATGKRDLERGEPQDVTRRDMEQWYLDTGGQGEPPHDWSTAKGGRAPIPRPWHDES